MDIRKLEIGAVFVAAFAAFLSTTGLHFNAAQAVPVAVPEPAGIGLLAVGAASVAAVVGLRRFKARGKGD